MIEAPVATDAIRRAYDLLSPVYGCCVVPLERKPRQRGLALAEIKPQDRVLEVAVGTGAAMLEILKCVDKTNVVSGVDLSHRMLEKTRRAVAKAGFTNVELRPADARSLPFEGGSFDLLFNSYMLDLVPLAEIPPVLAEFRRVLNDNGRLVLVNMSRGPRMTRWEKLYRATPSRLIPYLYGGCRPVFVEQPLREAGFREVRREFIDHGLRVRDRDREEMTESFSSSGLFAGISSPLAPLARRRPRWRLARGVRLVPARRASRLGRAGPRRASSALGRCRALSGVLRSTQRHDPKVLPAQVGSGRTARVARRPLRDRCRDRAADPVLLLAGVGPSAGPTARSELVPAGSRSRVTRWRCLGASGAAIVGPVRYRTDRASSTGNRAAATTLDRARAVSLGSAPHVLLRPGADLVVSIPDGRSVAVQPVVDEPGCGSARSSKNATSRTPSATPTVDTNRVSRC